MSAVAQRAKAEATKPSFFAAVYLDCFARVAMSAVRAPAQPGVNGPSADAARGLSLDLFRKSATPKDISVERAPDVFQMSSLDNYTATL